MESNFNNREFEHYVKSSADQYRMIPSEKVWRGIDSTLHTRRRWYAIGLSFFLLLTAVSVTWVMVSYPDSKKQPTGIAQEVASSPKASKQTGTATEQASKNNNILSFNKYSKQENTSVADALLLNNATAANTEAVEPPVAQIDQEASGETNSRFYAGRPDVAAITPDLITPISDNAVTNTPNHGSTEPGTMRLNERKQSQQKNFVYQPLTIESVTNAFKAPKMIKKLIWEVYFTPTISYRKLSLNKSYDGVSPFSASNYPFASLRDVNSEVVHKPDMGVEVGVSAGYPVTKNLRLIGGLQFNINRYDIKAFAYYGEQATIDLNGTNNSLTAWTFYRNHDGYKSDWLKNYYFSVSAPIGAEVKVLGNKKTYLGVAGTIQPTYILKDRAFLISTDYKNYVEVPRLIRHVNVNTSFEAFISYTSRSQKTRWQIGPQVRYQILSSFKSPYPVRENLFDFGLKFGVSRNK